MNNIGPAKFTRRPLVTAAAIIVTAIAVRATPSTAQCSSERGGLLIDHGQECIEAPVLVTDIEIAVTGIIARTRVTQRFYNPSDSWVEGTYIFPLPDGAAVDHLLMYIGPRVIEGRIEEREKARQTYVRARDSGVKASLVEQDRPNVFRTSIANIGPQEEIEIEIELQHLVRYDAGEFRLRFPTVVAPRFLPGAASDEDSGESGPADDPAMELANAAQRAIHPINPIYIEVTIDSGFELRSLYSPSHHIETAEIVPNKHFATLRDQGFADRDFTLVWRPEIGHEPASTVFHEEIDGDTYALLMILPGADQQPSDHFSREAIFVIDTSGSMGGPSIHQAKLALLMALDELRPGDWFDVIDFDSEARSLFGASVAANADSIQDARDFVDGLTADGGTNIRDALEMALTPSPVSADLRQVVFITDGAVGNEAELFRQVDEHLGDTRLFTVGIGAAPNAHFMRKAAHFGRGSYTYIGTPEEISVRMEELFEKLDSAALTDIEIRWHDLAIPEVWPATIPDLYAGEPLIVTARLAYVPDEIEISAARADEDWHAIETLDDGTAHSRDRGIGRLWARQKIEALMDDLALGAQPDRIKEEVTALAIDHNLVSRYTSLVAVDVSATAPAGEAQHKLLPLNRPAGLLPNTATPAALHAAIGMMLLAAGLLTRRRPITQVRHKIANDQRRYS